MASNDHIGWLTDACQYVEFSFESVQLGSYTCPNGYDRQHMVDGGVALSSANDLLILPTGGRPLGPLAPLELDRAANTWKTVPVTLDSAEPQLILGFDGLTLVTSGYSKSANSLSMRRYAWSERVPASQ